MRVKDTLNLGRTKFPMRGKLPVTEAQREQLWEENKVYQLRQRGEAIIRASRWPAIR